MADVPEKDKEAASVAASNGKEVAVDLTAGDAPKSDEKGEEKGDDAWAAYWRIFTFAGPFEYTLQGIAVFAAIASGAGIALQNLIFGEFVTVITNYGTGVSSPEVFRQDAATLALYFLYLGIGRFVLSYLYNTTLTYVGYRVARNIRQAYLRSALSQEVAFFDLGEGGSIATQATSNGRLIQGGISEKFGLTFQGLAAFVTAFAIAFATQWKLTFICLCIAPATIIVMGVAAGFAAKYETKILVTNAQGNSFAEGVLASARTVHAFEIRRRLVGKFDEYLAEAHTHGNKLWPIMGVLFSTEYTIIYLGFALAFWQGINMLAKGQVDTPGDIFTVLLSVVIGSLNLTILAPYAIDFSRSASAAAALFKLIDRVSDINPFDASGEEPSEIIGEVGLENITFSYPTRPGVAVLEDFSLKVPAGKVTALVGQSGSGKSTIVGLIERWYKLNKGTITLDGRPIDSLNLHWLRTNVRLVQQEPVLFRGSVFNNIAYGFVGTRWENASREEKMVQVQEAAKIAFAHDFISELPNGYDTDIGQKGSLLSGGQKQRIAIARSVVSQPKVLLLDEATSALDPHAEGIVQQALDRAAEGRTTIVIAHKLATIRKADNIVVMKKGRIVEQGTHEGLIAQDGAYARLVKIQDLSVSGSGSGSDTEDDTAVAGNRDDHIAAAKTLTRYATADQTRLEAQKERDNFDSYKHQGLLAIVWRLVTENPELGWMYFIALVGCVLGSAAIPGQAILMAEIMDVFALVGQEMIDRGNFFATMFIVMAAGCGFSYFILGVSTTQIAYALSHKIRRQTFNNMLRQDLQFFDRPENNIGALASRIDSNAQSIFELMGINVGLILIAILNVGACCILGIVYSWKLGLVVVLAGMPPLAGSGYLKIRADARLDQKVSNRHSQSSAIASEAVNAIRTVSSLAIEESVLERYTQELDHAVAGSVRPLCLMMLWFAFTQAIEYWFMALGFWYGCRLVSFGEIDMYHFFVTFMAVFFSGQSTSQLFQFSTSMSKGKNAANYTFWLGQLQPTVAQTDENRDKGPKSGGPIALEAVRFSYPLRPDAVVLKGVDLEIQKGQFVAVVGASGCGKSTVIAMLERFYDPSTGTIQIAGDAITDLNPRLYRGIVSLVQQEPALFQGSIRENIALGVDTEVSEGDASATVPDSEIENALRAANAWDFVSSLPDGLATFAGPNGTQLSGGQRQRIAIARSLIRHPKVLLLDEATSALDTESEKIVQSSLAQAAKEGDRITIAVAHRLSTIKDADVICVFYHGRIVEKGTHAELVALGGMYRKMCEAQNLD